MALLDKVVKAVARHLPMDEASRLGRAREMGFDVDTPLYHGTASDFDEFSLNNPRMKSGKLGEGIYLTPDPKAASFFAKISSDKGDGAARVLPVYARMKNPYVIASERDIPAGGISREKLSAAGYDGIVLQDGERTKEIVVFDPKNIRGKFAQFDPSQSHSSKLLAAVPAAIGAGGLLALSKRQQGAA